MSNNTYGAVVNVHEAEDKGGFISLRVFEPEAKENEGGYVSRWMDINIGDKSPAWIQLEAKTIKKGDRLYVEGTLRSRAGKTPGKTFESIQFIRRFAKLATTNSPGARPSGLDDF